MTQTLEAVATAAQQLSMREKLQLLQLISADLQQTAAFQEASQSFWQPKELTALIEDQNPSVVSDLRLLRADFWPDDETADDINAFVANQRLADRSRIL